jgi:xanthine dehydrogenase accessory factor
MALFDRIAGLERAHASFAIATVVARRSPVSSHLGDRALVFADGHMEGFVGGSCSRDIVRRVALDAIASRQPLLLQIRPDTRSAATAEAAGARAQADCVIIPMSCSSEGAVDVYIEPRVPLRRLVVVGLTPVAEALAHIAVLLDYDVVRVVAESELRDVPAAGGNAAGARVIDLKSLAVFLDALNQREVRDLIAVVASQGHYDELALETLLARPIAFTGLLASRRRAATVAAVLAQQGLPAERVATIHNPVGLDIGARSPGEVAISILAEIIAHGKNAPAAPVQPAAPDETALVTGTPGNIAAPEGRNAALEVDPVCGMDVETAAALYRLEQAGHTYFFCGAHCRAAFSADPERYLVPLGAT